MSEKSKREQQQKWLRTSHSCTTSWLLVVTQKSGQTLTFEPSALVQLKMCGASQYKPRQRTFDRGGVFVKACPMYVDHAHTHAAVSAVASVSAVAAARGLALCPWYHPAWVSVGTPVGPGQGTHGTLGPDQREGRGWPAHSLTQQCRVQYSSNTAQKHTKHDVLLRCVWFHCLSTTNRRTSSRLVRCVMFACAPIRFTFSHLHLLEHSLSHDRLGMPIEAILDTGGRFLQKGPCRGLSLPNTDPSDISLPRGQRDNIPETPKVSLLVSSSQREAPKPEVSTCTQEHIEAPLPPLQPRSTCERLELPFSCDAILSGYEDVHLPSSDQFTMWGKMTLMRF